jgi:hypothetical protein
VCIHTTGRTIEENLNFITTQKNNAQIGDQDPTSTIIGRVAHQNTSVYIAMGGKSKSTTQKAISLILANIVSNVGNLIVHTFTLIKIEDLHSKFGLKYFLKLGSLISPPIITCHILEI